MVTPSNEYPEKSLLLEHTRPNTEDRILILEGGDGWLAREAAALVPKGQVSTYDRDIRNHDLAQLRLAPLSNTTSEPQALPNTEGWDIVLLTIPKERSFSKLLLIVSFRALKLGGRLLLAGPSRKGAKAVIKDAVRLFGNGSLLDYRRHQRVARCLKQDEQPNPLPEEFQIPGIAPDSSYTLEVKTPFGVLTLRTCPGIFSWQKIDMGTSMLLEHLAIEPGSVVWDVGCGYGIIGLTAAFSGAGTVLMSDTNTLAVNYAQKNAVSNKLSLKTLIYPASVLTLPETLSHPNKFDLIISNPAFHKGRMVDKSMADQIISRARSFLKPRGRLLLVANCFLNYDKSMQTIFKQVKIIAGNNHFHVMEGWN